MSQPVFISGPPAFTSLLPSFPVPQPAGKEMKVLAEAYCGKTLSIESMGAPGQTVEGRYLVKNGDDGSVLFLKVFEKSLLDLQRHSAAVASFLYVRGISSVCALPNEPRPFSPGYFGMLFPAIDARFSLLTEMELRKIGSLLAEMREALKHFPNPQRIEEFARKMHHELHAVATGPHQSFGTPTLDRLVDKSMRLYASGDLHIFRQPQMIHGDCNYTNFLVDRENGKIWIIDFEESLAAWLSPMFDVAKVVQRFVMMGESEDAKIKLARALFYGYRESGGRIPSDIDFAVLLREIVARLVMILVHKSRDGAFIPQAEWEKFAALDAVIDESSYLLKKISYLALEIDQDIRSDHA